MNRMIEISERYFWFFSVEFKKNLPNFIKIIFMNRVTEQESNYNHIDQMSVLEVLQGINNEDKTVAFAVEKSLPQIEKLTSAVAERMKKGGRLRRKQQELIGHWLRFTEKYSFQTTKFFCRFMQNHLRVFE